jgi:hypothetical protein
LGGGDAEGAFGVGGGVVGAGLAELGLAAVVVAGDEGFAIGDEVGDLHAGLPDVAAGVDDVATQGDGVLEAVDDGGDGDDVAVLHGRVVGGGEVDVDDGALGVVEDALDAGARFGGDAGESAGEGDDLIEGFFVAQLVDGGTW